MLQYRQETNPATSALSFFHYTLEAKTSSVKIFVGKYFRHLPKISSLLTDENFNLVFYMITFLQWTSLYSIPSFFVISLNELDPTHYKFVINLIFGLRLPLKQSIYS